MQIPPRSVPALCFGIGKIFADGTRRPSAAARDRQDQTARGLRTAPPAPATVGCRTNRLGRTPLATLTSGTSSTGFRSTTRHIRAGRDRTAGRGRAPLEDHHRHSPVAQRWLPHSCWGLTGLEHPRPRTLPDGLPLRPLLRPSQTRPHMEGQAVDDVLLPSPGHCVLVPSSPRCAQLAPRVTGSISRTPWARSGASTAMPMTAGPGRVLITVSRTGAGWARHPQRP
jgi:hypothetical protein